MTGQADVFVAEDAGPPRRRLYIYYEGLVGATAPPRGWRFVCEEEGTDEPLRSTWEEWFFEILRYPPKFASASLDWRRASDQQRVDLATLQAEFDGIRAGPDDDPVSLGLAGH